MATTTDTGALRCLLLMAALASSAPTHGQAGLSSRSVPAASAVPERAHAHDASLLLGPGDLVEVQVFNTPELSARLRVSQRGTVLLPVGGEVSIAGCTPADAAALVEKRLREGEVMSDPHVTVFVDEYTSQGVTVLGEVRTPGTFNLMGDRSLYRALAAAGGTSANAGGSITVAHRAAPEHPTVLQVRSPDYPVLERSTMLQPGDIVTVARAELVYVVGDVSHPGAYAMQNGEPISVLNALALAAGLSHTAAASKASIVRKTAGGAVTIPVNLDRVMKNKDSNPVLQAADVLVVPRSGSRVLLETALPGATAAVTGAVATALVLR